MKTSSNGTAHGTNGHERIVKAVAEQARKARECGLCVVPPREDGSKGPESERVGDEFTWKHWRANPPDEATHNRWFPGRHGLGVLCGRVSGGVDDGAGGMVGGFEVLEFDDGKVYERFKADAVEAGLGGLVERIEAGYLEETPGGGVHWPYFCTVVKGNEKLAQRPGPPTEDGKPTAETLIETRGEGGFIILAPSGGPVHPSGKSYRRLRGDLGTIATIAPEERADLLDLARSFDEMPKPGPDEKAWNTQADNAEPGGWKVRPGDAYAAETSWEALLTGAEWRKARDVGECSLWRRPGKDRSWSASVNRGGSGLLYVWSSSTPFPTERGINKFAAYTFLHHSGDFKKATKDLFDKGFGEKAEKKDKGQQDGQAEDVDYSKFTEADLGIVSARDVEEEAIEWAWENRFAFGSAALMAAEGGLGKTFLALYCAAQVTVEGPWPDGSGNAPLGDVIVVSAEDRAEDTLKPRLVAMGADVSRIWFIKAKVTVRRPNKPPQVHFMSFQDHAYWQEVFRRIPECRILLVDPLPAYLGKGVNDHRNNEVRSVMEPFIETIIKPRRCVLLCISHLNKSIDSRTPQNRILGSVAYANIPRNVHVVFKDQEVEGRRIFAQTKCNNAPDDLPALAFRIEKRTIQANGKAIETAIPVFEAETVKINVQEAMSGNGKPGPKPRKTEALAEWLFDRLKDRPQPEPLGMIADAAGAAGLLGKQVEDKKTGHLRWSNFTCLYRAKDAVKGLPGPRAGFEIEETEVGGPEIRMGNRVVSRGRPRKHWALIRGGEPVPGDQPF